MTTSEIVELAAKTVIDSIDASPRHVDETHLRQLAWNMGDRIDYERALVQFAEAVIQLSNHS